jgi:3-hydroxyacyl-CoA dehydrogenase
LVENGVASTDDVDQAVQLGLARRWRQAGLFASVYLGGAAQWETIANNLFPNLSNATEARGLATLVLGMSDRWEGSRERRDLALAEDRGNGVPNEALARSARRLRT